MKIVERLILAYAHNEEDLQAFVKFLKKHFLSVVCLGINRNDRDPYKGGVRGYITVTGDPTEGDVEE